MYEDGASFDPTSMAEDGFSQTAPPPECLTMPPPPLLNGIEDTIHLPNLSMEDFASFHPNTSQESSAMAAEFQRQLQFDMGEQQHQHGFSSDHEHNLLMHEAFHMQDLDFNGHHHLQQQQFDRHHIQQQAFNSSPELLNLFQLPRCSASSLLPIHNSSISFDPAEATSGIASTVLYDPLLHLNLPPQPPLFRDLFQSLPHGYGGGFVAASPATAGSLLGGMVDDGEGSGGGHVNNYDHGDGDGNEEFGGQFENGVLEFTRGIACNLGKKRKGNKGKKHFATEKQRREHLNEKYTALGSLVPNPTKIDRASIVGDAIEYIKELLRTVSELKLLVAKKRCGRSKRHKAENSTVTGAIENCNNLKPFGDPDRSSYSGPSSPLRSSWLLRKSKDTEVDVRIIEDEVTIKLVQRKKINCLLYVSKTLDELQLDLHHVAGGHIGDYYSFFFNTKIYEGSCVYASAIANKLIEVVDKQYTASVPPTSSSF